MPIDPRVVVAAFTGAIRDFLEDRDYCLLESTEEMDVDLNLDRAIRTVYDFASLENDVTSSSQMRELGQADGLIRCKTGAVCYSCSSTCFPKNVISTMLHQRGVKNGVVVTHSVS